MNFLENLFEKLGNKPPRQFDGPSRHASGPYGPDRRDHREAEARATHPDRHDGRPGAFGLRGMLGALLRNKVLWAVAALLLLVLAGGAALALVILLPLAGQLLDLGGSQNLAKLLTDLPRLLSTLLVDLPKAVLDYLGPLLQLKTTLEGKG